MGGSTECLSCGGKSRNPFAMILVPLERGGLRRHFELLSIEIHRRSSEKSSLEVGQVVTFWTLGSLKNDHKRWNEKKSYMKPLAKKRYNLADLGDFEGFVDLYPCRSRHYQISSTPVLLSDAV